MAWPTTKATTTSLDAGTDDPNVARPQIKQNVDNVNDIIDFLNMTSLADGDLLQYDATAGDFKNVTRASIGAQQVIRLGLLSNTGRNTNYYRFTVLDDPYGLATITTGAVGADGKLRLSTGDYIVESFMYDAANYDSNPFFASGGSGDTEAITLKVSGFDTIGTNNEAFDIPSQKFTVSSALTDYYIKFDSSNTNDPLTNPTNVIVTITKI